MAEKTDYDSRLFRHLSGGHAQSPKKKEKRASAGCHLVNLVPGAAVSSNALGRPIPAARAGLVATSQLCGISPAGVAFFFFLSSFSRLATSSLSGRRQRDLNLDRSRLVRGLVLFPMFPVPPPGPLDFTSIYPYGAGIFRHTRTGRLRWLSVTACDSPGSIPPCPIFPCMPPLYPNAMDGPVQDRGGWMSVPDGRLWYETVSIPPPSPFASELCSKLPRMARCCRRRRRRRRLSLAGRA